jgi:dihydrofolate reductase
MIRLIAAVDRKRGVAKQGFMPWNIPEDEQYFTDLTKTLGGHVLSGRATFDLAYKRVPLAERHNYILTHDKTPINGAEVTDDLDSLLENFKDRDLWVSGGSNVFTQIIERGKADVLYITHIDADFGCNQFFPEFASDFELTKQSELHEQNGFSFRYSVYKKQHKAST